MTNFGSAKLQVNRNSASNIGDKKRFFMSKPLELGTRLTGKGSVGKEGKNPEGIQMHVIQPANRSENDAES